MEESGAPGSGQSSKPCSKWLTFLSKLRFRASQLLMLRSRHYFAAQCSFFFSSIPNLFRSTFKIVLDLKFFTFYFPGDPGLGWCQHLSSKWLTFLSKLRFRASQLLLLRSQHYIAAQCNFLWAFFLLNNQPFTQHFQNCIALRCKFFTFYFPGPQIQAGAGTSAVSGLLSFLSYVSERPSCFCCEANITSQLSAIFSGPFFS